MGRENSYRLRFLRPRVNPEELQLTSRDRLCSTATRTKIFRIILNQAEVVTMGELRIAIDYKCSYMGFWQASKEKVRAIDSSNLSPRFTFEISIPFAKLFEAISN